MPVPENVSAISALIPITTANGMGPLPRLLEEMAGPRAVTTVFAAEKLPLELIDQPEMRLPQPVLANVFERAAKATGERTFGLNVGAMTDPSSLGLWVEYAASGRDLATALRRIVRAIGFHQIGAPMSLEKMSDHVVWRYRPASGSLGGRHHSDHAVPMMLRFVRAYLGTHWRPDWIEFNYPQDQAASKLDEFLQTRLRFGCGAVGLAIAMSDFNRLAVDAATHARRRVVTWSDLQANAVWHSLSDPQMTIEALILLRLLGGDVDIEGTARMAGMSVRSLQRLLDRMGQTYSGILGRVRHRRARDLLVETEMPITQIALTLGYSDSANFTRAFRRWSGRAPRQVRNDERTAQTVLLSAAG